MMYSGKDHSQNKPPLSRRKFLEQMSVASLIVSLHPTSLFANHTSKIIHPHKTHLIDNIRLQTSTSLNEMVSYYHQLMGFPIIEQKSEEITFRIGVSTLTFIFVNDGSNPWYHFAFNIPENKILKAREWLLERSDIIPTPLRAQDPHYPKDVRHFKHWNAHSLFFWDPAGNLLEFIARHDLNNASEGSFSQKDILNISEIAFVVDDQNSIARIIHKELELSVYPKNANFWWAMGDELGLLLCIPKRVWGENTDAPKTFEVFPTEASIVSNYTKELHFKSFPYLVKSKKN